MRRENNSNHSPTEEAGDTEGYDALRDYEEEIYLPLSSADSPAASDSYFAAMSSVSSHGQDSTSSRISDSPLHVKTERPALPPQRSDSALTSIMQREPLSTSGALMYPLHHSAELHDDTPSYGRSLFERMSHSLHFSKPSAEYQDSSSLEERSIKAAKGSGGHQGISWMLSRQKGGHDSLSYSEHDGRAIAALQRLAHGTPKSHEQSSDAPIFHRIKSGIGLRRKVSTMRRDSLSYSEHGGMHEEGQPYPSILSRDDSNSSLVSIMRSRMSDARMLYGRALHDNHDQESVASTQADSERGIMRASSNVLSSAKKRLSKHAIHLHREGSTSNLFQKIKTRFSDAGNVITAGVKGNSELNTRKTSITTTGSDHGPPVAEDKAKLFWTALSSKLKKKKGIANPVGQLKEALEERTRSKEDLNKMWLIHPLRTFKLRWDTFFGILIIITTAYIPFKIAFSDEVNSSFDFGFEIFVVFFFCVDIILTFNTAVFNELTGLLITDRRKIAWRYLKFWFWIDILSSFPFDLIASAVDGNGTDISYFPLFRLLRYAKVLHSTLSSFSLTRAAFSTLPITSWRLKHCGYGLHLPADDLRCPRHCLLLVLPRKLEFFYQS